MLYVDEKTKQMLRELQERFDGITPWPLVLIARLNRYPQESHDFRWLYLQQDYRQTISKFSHKPDYADCYRCLAYHLYGYGNLSNNDRRRKGLKPRRVPRGVFRND